MKTAKEMREACAVLVETMPLELSEGKYPRMEDRTLMRTVEAGCRGAFAAAIRNTPLEETASDTRAIGLDMAIEHITAQKRVWKSGDIDPDRLLDVIVDNLEALKKAAPQANPSAIAPVTSREPAESAPSCVEKSPMAWMRRWAFDGQKPQKELDNGRLKWPKRFRFLPVTTTRCADDDVPLYPAQVPAEKEPK